MRYPHALSRTSLPLSARRTRLHLLVQVGQPQAERRVRRRDHHPRGVALDRGDWCQMRTKRPRWRLVAVGRLPAPDGAVLGAGEHIRRVGAEASLERLLRAFSSNSVAGKGSHELARKGVKLGTDYPYPIVDHAFARERCLNTYKLAREKT